MNYPKFKFTISFTTEDPLLGENYDCFMEELMYNEGSDCTINHIASQHFQLDFDREAANERAAWTTAIAAVVEAAQDCNIKLTGFCLSGLNPYPSKENL